MVAPRGWEEKGEKDELERPLSTELLLEHVIRCCALA